MSKTVEKLFNRLLVKIGDNFTLRQIQDIKKAYAFAKMAHTGQKRLSGDLFVTHPLAVANILIDWNLDATTIIAGLLHDTIEDGAALKADLSKEFGTEVCRLVGGVTNITNIRLTGGRDEEFVENLRRMILVMAKDLRVVILKLADRLHNMRTLKFLPKKSRVENARETLEIYAPLSQRLGIGIVRRELEDLAFVHLHPDDYKELVSSSKPYYKNTQKTISSMKKKIMKRLTKDGIGVKIGAREKGYYSLWKKLQRPEVDGDLDKINDIVALRIVTRSVPDCYTVLGVLHSLYKPVPSLGVSDFIAQPKPNGYQSIHTKVFGTGGKIAEVQIRTQKMHEEAEYGAAAHWVYSEAKLKGAKDEKLEKEGVIAHKDKLKWMNELVAWQGEIKNSQEYLRAVKFDGFHNRIFVFSPKGDAYDLPAGATPVDFAFAVHTHLGRHIKRVMINRRLVPLDQELKNGDIVEIIKTKESKKPNRDWLSFVVTRLARSEIQKINGL